MYILNKFHLLCVFRVDFTVYFTVKLIIKAYIIEHSFCRCFTSLCPRPFKFLYFKMKSLKHASVSLVKFIFEHLDYS